MLTYDDSRHEYSDSGEIIPSVTQLLSSYFEIDSSHYAPGAAERGTRAHELCAAYAAGKTAKLDNGYALAFADWCLSTGAEPLEIEQMVEGEIGGRRFAGRFDLTVRLCGARVLVDLKTGARAKWHHAQVAAYSYVARPARAMVLYLHEDGTWRPEMLTSRELLAGLETFKAALAAWEKKE